MRAFATTIRVKPDDRERYLEATRRLAAASASEPGCQHFGVIQSDDDPNTILIYEAYRDQASAEMHHASPHYKAWRDTVKDWYGEPPEVIRGTSVHAVDPGPGGRG